MPETAIDLAPRAIAALKPISPSALLPLDQRPAHVYVAGLLLGSRRAMWGALAKIADLITKNSTHDNFPWHRLRFQHTSAVRAALQENYAISYARKMVCALKGVLRAAWRLGQIATEEYHRAIDLPPIRGESLPKEWALTPGEVRALFLAGLRIMASVVRLMQPFSVCFMALACAAVRPSRLIWY